MALEKSVVLGDPVVRVIEGCANTILTIPMPESKRLETKDQLLQRKLNEMQRVLDKWKDRPENTVRLADLQTLIVASLKEIEEILKELKRVATGGVVDGGDCVSD